MSDHNKNEKKFRRAQPLFMGLRRKRNGDVQNLVKDNEKKFAKQAEKALIPFVKQRYNMYRDFTRAEVGGEVTYAPRIAQLLSQHVYGDYALMSGGYEFRHRKSPLVGAPLGMGPRRLYLQDPIYQLQDGRSNFEGMEVGLMGAGINPATGEYDATPAELFEEIVNSRDPSSIFFLPSLGTAVMDIASITDAWPTALYQYFKGQRNKENSGRIPELFNRITVNTYDEDDRKLGTEAKPLLRAPWFEYTSGPDPMFDRLLSLAYDNNVDAQNLIDAEKSVFFMAWATMILDSGLSLTPEQETLLSRIAIQATFNHTNDTMGNTVIASLGFDASAGELIPIPAGYISDGMDPTGATFEFLYSIEELFAAAAVTDEGKTINLLEDSDFFMEVFMDQEIAGHDRTDTNPRTPYATAQGYSGSPAFEDWVDNAVVNGETVFEPDGEWTVFRHEGNRYIVQQVGYLLTEDPDTGDLDVDLDTEQVYEISGLRAADFEFVDEDEEDEADVSTAVGRYNEEQILFTRVLLDCYFEMESHLSLVLNSNKIDFRRYSSEYKEVDEDFHREADFHKTNAKKQKPVADFLAEERASIMSGLVASFLALAGDANFKKLYEQDLNLLEINWYSDFIAQRLLQAVPPEEQVNQLRQRVAIPAPAIGEVFSMQLVTPSTLIRTLDVPTLRMIMRTYFQRFYAEVASIAEELDKAPKSKKKKKKGKGKKPLFEQMWNTVEATVVTMLSLEGANPATYWRRTFAQVDGSREPTQMILPPSWAGTISRTDLETDKFSIGLQPDIEKSIQLFKSYISFLKSTYTRSEQAYKLIAGLLTAFQSTGSDSIKDIKELQDFFMQRLKNDENFKLRGRSIPAYRQFIYICRETLTVPSYVLAATMAMNRVDEVALTPRASDAAELEGGIMMGPAPTEFERPAPPPTLGPMGFPPLPNPSILRPNMGASE